jgi:hypothetical protein
MIMFLLLFEVVFIQAGVIGLVAELAEFVRVESVVMMMRVSLNRVAAIAFLAFLYVRIFAKGRPSSYGV